jgi:phosphoribosyl-ATP pyrophosphohydrolase/phosphoribosyl-AMP cyclohydrolase
MTGLTVPGPVDLEAGVDPAAVRWDEAGLVVGVVQDVADGRVLMVGWLDVEALAATLGTGEVHFHSRSRGRLWRKGETSGNVLRLRSLALDCDGDALLIGAEPAGPTCHRDTRSCFDPNSLSQAVPGQSPAAVLVAPPSAEAQATAAQPVPVAPAPDGQGFAWLEQLWTTIAGRAVTRPHGSYTVALLDGGVDLAGRKVTEEATEVLLAAKNDQAAEAAGESRLATRELLAGEAGDLLYHALVLLAERGLEPRAVLEVLRERHGRPAGSREPD